VHANPINLGKGAAVRLGFHHATGDVLLIQDADLELDPGQYGVVLAPLVDGRAEVVYGSRFLAPSAPAPIGTRFGNWLVTTLTNVLFGVRLTDMETGSKAMRREALSGLRLRAVGFDIEPELTGKLLRSGRRIHEVPIQYAPRTTADGKKIRWVDAFDAVYTLLKARFGQSGRPQRIYTTADDGGGPVESRASYR
jgi:glycosyltransferase involved in cell wall biosynthesis